MHIALTPDYLDSLEQRMLWPGFGVLVHRTRSLLHNRTPDQIRYALDAVNFILENPKTDDTPNTAVTDTNSPFLAERLQTCVPYYDIGKILEFPQATWTELFAVLALGLLGEAAQTFRGWPTAAPPSWYPSMALDLDPSVQDTLPPVDAYSFACFLAAVEALAYAQAQVRIPIEVKKRISLRAKSGGIARHAAAREIEEDFCRYYEAGTFRSVRTAATLFCKEREGIFDVLDKGNAVRTLKDYYNRRAAQLGIKTKKNSTKDA